MCRVDCLSNTPEPHAHELERRHAFLRWFDGGIVSGDVLHIKPNPATYELLQLRYALEPGRTVFIDDLRVNVMAAHEQGWHAIQFESPAKLQADLSAYLG